MRINNESRRTELQYYSEGNCLQKRGEAWHIGDTVPGVRCSQCCRSSPDTPTGGTVPGVRCSQCCRSSPDTPTPPARRTPHTAAVLRYTGQNGPYTFNRGGVADPDSFDPVPAPGFCQIRMQPNAKRIFCPSGSGSTDPQDCTLVVNV
jgi:hypothetical protein